MKPQQELATSKCPGTRLVCALLPSLLFAFIGDRRKHQPNLRTRPDRTSGNITVYRSAATPLALSSLRTAIQTP
jgi:hypothetical protein